MGPPPFGDGKIGSLIFLLIMLLLQWGHRLSAMESASPVGNSARNGPASMGPPPFGDGKGSRIVANAWPGACFNGATAFRRWKVAPADSLASRNPSRLQWGHRLSAMERGGAGGLLPPVLGRFNGATAFRRWKAHNNLVLRNDPWKLQWGHRLSAMERPNLGGVNDGSLFRFNGATAFRRWKAGPHRAARPRLGSRFNGATAFRRWKAQAAYQAESTSERFNGATAFRRWKEEADADVWFGVVGASMGPPPFGDGKVLVVMHRLFAVHASMGPPPFGDGKTATISSGTGYTAGFNGATAFRRWKGQGHNRLASVLLRFNGATAFRRWKAGQFQGSLNVSSLLQWGHRLSAMESAICADFRSSVYDVVQSLPHQSPKSVSSSCLVAAHSQFRSCESARGLREGPHHWTSRKAPLFVPHTIMAVLRGSSRAFPKTA